MTIGKAGERAKWLRRQAENLSEEVDDLRAEAKDLDRKADALDAQADEAERDDPAEDHAWAELHAARADVRQGRLV